MSSSIERIVSLLSSATEILFAIGVGDRVVAVSHECDFPPEITGLPRVTRSIVDSTQNSQEIDDQVRARASSNLPLYELDSFEISRLRPQLIVTQSQCDVCAIDYDQVLSLVAHDAQLAETRVIPLHPQKLADVLADIETLGRVVGVESKAAEYVSTLSQRIDAVVARTEKFIAPNRPRTICIEWIEPLMLAANWTPELITFAGGLNGLTISGQHSGYANWEEVVEFDPEVILIAPCGFDLPRTMAETPALRRLPGWQTLSAVRNSRVFAIDGNAYFNRSGPRLVDSLEIAAHLIHPGLFPDVVALNNPLAVQQIVE